MKKLLVYLKDYKKETILAPLFKMLEALFELFVPLVMKQIIDVGIGTQDKPLIFRLCLLMAGLALIGLACSITAQYFAAKASVGFAASIKHQLFAHIQHLSFSDLDKVGSSTLITRMTSDMNQVQSGVNLTLRLFLRSPFIVFGAMVMAFTINVQAALVFVVAIPLLAVVVFGVMLATIPLYVKVQGALDKVLKRTRENLTGVRVVRAFRREAAEEQGFREENNALKKFQTFVGRISALTNPVTYVIINAAICVLIYVGAIDVKIGILTQGAVIALINYMNQILVELVKLANLIINMTRSVACGNRVEEVMSQFENEEVEGSVKFQMLSEKETSETSGVPMVKFDHVTMSYTTADAPSLEDISFSVNRGETIGIIGGTGSGKSTLVHLIPGFYPTTEGSVSIHGVNVKDYEMDELRKNVGIVMQKACLFRGTIRENLLWGKEDATDEELWEALENAQAADFVREKEHGLSEMVGQEGKNFSGGQRQRLSIARALVRKPEILILDDSASALDYATDAALRRAISKMNHTMTIFIVSQRTASLMGADHIVVLDDGKMVGFGTHEELLASCEVYREIYESQYGKEAMA